MNPSWSSAHSKQRIKIVKEIPGISHHPLVSIFSAIIRPWLTAPLSQPHHHAWRAGYYSPPDRDFSRVSLTSIPDDSSLAKSHHHPPVCQAHLSLQSSQDLHRDVRTLASLGRRKVWDLQDENKTDWVTHHTGEELRASQASGGKGKLTEQTKHQDCHAYQISHRFSLKSVWDNPSLKRAQWILSCLVNDISYLIPKTFLTLSTFMMRRYLFVILR